MKSFCFCCLVSFFLPFVRVCVCVCCFLGFCCFVFLHAASRKVFKFHREKLSGESIHVSDLWTGTDFIFNWSNIENDNVNEKINTWCYNKLKEYSQLKLSLLFIQMNFFGGVCWFFITENGRIFEWIFYESIYYKKTKTLFGKFIWIKFWVWYMYMKKYNFFTYMIMCYQLMSYWPEFISVTGVKDC